MLRWSTICRGSRWLGLVLFALAFSATAWAQGPGNAAAPPTAPRAYTLPYVVTVMMVVLGMTAACMPTIRRAEIDTPHDDD